MHMLSVRYVNSLLVEELVFFTSDEEKKKYVMLTFKCGIYRIDFETLSVSFAFVARVDEQQLW